MNINKSTLRFWRDILVDILHEKSPGIHTYHNCSCGRGHTRRGICDRCLTERLIKEIESSLNNK